MRACLLALLTCCIAGPPGRLVDDVQGYTSDADVVMGGQTMDLDPEFPRDSRRGRFHYELEPRAKFVKELIRAGVTAETAEVVAYALGDDEIDNLPPQFVNHLVTGLLHIESTYKKAQMALAAMNANAQFLVAVAIPAEQMKMNVTVNTILAPYGLLYGNDAIVKRIQQALSLHYQRQLASPYPWTYSFTAELPEHTTFHALDTPTGYRHRLPVQPVFEHLITI